MPLARCAVLSGRARGRRATPAPSCRTVAGSSSCGKWPTPSSSRQRYGAVTNWPDPCAEVGSTTGSTAPWICRTGTSIGVFIDRRVAKSVGSRQRTHHPSVVLQRAERRVADLEGAAVRVGRLVIWPPRRRPRPQQPRHLGGVVGAQLDAPVTTASGTRTRDRWHAAARGCAESTPAAVVDAASRPGRAGARPWDG